LAVRGIVRKHGERAPVASAFAARWRSLLVISFVYVLACRLFELVVLLATEGKTPTMRQQTAREQIVEAVTSWPGVEAGPGRRGEFAFRVGDREIGHLHGSHAAHFGFPKQVWRELREQGRIEAHPVFPDKEGPAARRIANDADIRDVIELLRLNYERSIARHGAPTKAV
jgi:hypothetical protein